MNNGKIGVQEKRELAKIITAEYQRKIDEVSSSIEKTEGDILLYVQKKLGVALINQRIKQLEKQIGTLKEKKEQLGFDSYDRFAKEYNKTNAYMVKEDTPAGKFYYSKVKRTDDVKSLIADRDIRLKQIWLQEKRPEVARLSTLPIKVKQITFQQ